MFTLIQPNYQGTSGNQNIGAWTRLQQASSSFGGISVTLQQNPASSSILVTTTRSGNLVTATIAPNLSLVAVYLGGVAYSPGQYNYNPLTGQLTITIASRASWSPLTYLTANNAAIYTTDICGLAISQFLKYWNFQGTVRISRTFAGHPSLQLDFEIPCDRENEARNDLCPGLIKGIQGNWRIRSLTIDETPKVNTLRVSLSAQGVHAPYNNPSRSLLDKQIPLKGGGVSGTGGTGGTGSLSYQKYIGLASFAQRAGVQYSGVNLTKRIPRTTSSQQCTTFRQELESLAPIGEGFPYYDNPQQVELRTFGGGKTHYISDDHKIGNLTTNYNGAGTEINGVKLTDELRNAIFVPDFDPDEKDTGGAGITIRWEFENAESLFQCTLAAEPQGWALVNPSIETLRSPRRNFDAGGFTKLARKITEFNGLPLIVEEWLYGYTYTSIDTHNIAGAQNNLIVFVSTNNPQSFWREVRHTVVNHIYDIDEGYLVEVITTGFEKTRLSQENETEAVQLYAQALQAGLNPLQPSTSSAEAQSLYNQALAYTFTDNLPIKDTTLYSLDDLRAYYEDIQKPDNDPDWIEPRYYHHKLRDRQDYILKSNPNSNNTISLPPKVVGKWTRERERIDISKLGFPERFTRRTENSNSEGEDGRNSLRLGSYSQNLGRPSTHTRLDRNIAPNNGNNNYQQYKDYRFWLSTLNSGTDFRCVEQTLSYPGVDDPAIAARAATTQYRVKNSRNAETRSLSILYRPDVEIGDFAIYRNTQNIIFAISEQYIVDGKGLQGTLNLTLGRYVDLNVSVVRANVGVSSGRGKLKRTIH